jgi:hypothetical protein
MYELKTMTVDVADLRTGDRIIISSGNRHTNSIRRVEVVDQQVVNVWVEGQAPNARPWFEYVWGTQVQIQRPTAPPADEMFDAIDRTDAAAAQFERDPQNIGSIEPAGPVAEVTSFAEEMIALVRKYETRVRSALLSADDEPRDRLFFSGIGETLIAVCGNPERHGPHWLDNIAPARDGAQTYCSGRLIVTAPDPRIAQPWRPAPDHFETDPIVISYERAVDEQIDEAELAAVQSGAEVVELPSRSEPAGTESREVGPVSVDVHGPWDRPVFEVGRWDTEEGAFVHVVSLTREEADALHTALGHTLYG